MEAFIFQADLYCRACADLICDATPFPKDADPHDESTFDSDEYPKGPFPKGGGAADSPKHCGGCGEFLENPLTGDGVEYTREMIDETALRCMRTMAEGGDTGARAALRWLEFYRHELRS